MVCLGGGWAWDAAALPSGTHVQLFAAAATADNTPSLFACSPSHGASPLHTHHLPPAADLERCPALSAPPCLQPLLGVEGDPMRLLFERDLTPHPQYAAFYRWLQVRPVGGC